MNDSKGKYPFNLRFIRSERVSIVGSLTKTEQVLAFIQIANSFAAQGGLS